MGLNHIPRMGLQEIGMNWHGTRTKLLSIAYARHFFAVWYIDVIVIENIVGAQMLALIKKA